MKLATLKNGTRDGQLVIVSRDLQRMTAAPASVNSMQQALDRWPEFRADLQARYEALNAHIDAGEAFDASRCAAALPRAYQWLDASAYLNHVEMTPRARRRNAAVLPHRSRDVPGRLGRLHRPAR